MESKVIESLLCSYNGRYYFDKNFCFSKNEGSGNNWAYGYFSHGESIKEIINTLINSLVEKLDFAVKNFIII